MVIALTADFEVLDERFRALAFPNVHLEKLYTGCRWAEGPAWFAAGRYLVWSDIPNDRMLRWDETDGSVSVFRAPAMNTNGHTVDREGRLVSCEHRGRCISRTGFDGKREVLVDRFEGKRLNSPNDLVVKSDGSIWFSDPSYGIDSDYEGDASSSEIGARNVYRFDPANGRLTVVADDFVQPNGLAFSGDESLLHRRHRRPHKVRPHHVPVQWPPASRSRRGEVSPPARPACTTVSTSTPPATCGCRPLTACTATRLTARCSARSACPRRCQTSVSVVRS
jgi:gluconolactonase